jgi:hypothetical protein
MRDVDAPPIGPECGTLENAADLLTEAPRLLQEAIEVPKQCLQRAILDLGLGHVTRYCDIHSITKTAALGKLDLPREQN